MLPAFLPGKLFCIGAACSPFSSSVSYLSLKSPPLPQSAIFLLFCYLFLQRAHDHVEYGVFIIFCYLSLSIRT